MTLCWGNLGDESLRELRPAPLTIAWASQGFRPSIEGRYSDAGAQPIVCQPLRLDTSGLRNEATTDSAPALASGQQLKVSGSAASCFP